MEIEKLITKKNKLHRYNIITNIILIIVFLLISSYIIYNFEIFKILSQDVCKMCTAKTGAICYYQDFIINFSKS